MRMLFLALWSPDRSPSQRYRIEQFLEYWNQRGLSTDYDWILRSTEMSDFYAGNVKAKLSLVARATARRVAGLSRHALRSENYDVVLVQRQAFFLGGPWVEWIASRRSPVVFDFDDAIWMRDVSNGNRHFAALKNVRKVPAIVRMASTVVAGNAYLAEWARAYNPNVVVVPTCVDTDRYVPGMAVRQPGEPVVVGWSGSPSTMKHFELVVPVLRTIKRKYGGLVRFKVVGDPGYRNVDLGICGEAWRSDQEVNALQAMDIGIMPLPDDEWAKGKCGLKALTYMATGTATVASPVGVNTEIIRDGVDGYLPGTEDEWVARLSQLIEDPEVRGRFGAAGRRAVEERYSVKRWREPLYRIIEQTARAASQNTRN